MKRWGCVGVLAATAAAAPPSQDFGNNRYRDAAGFGAAGAARLAEAVWRVQTALNHQLCVSMEGISATLDGFPTATQLQKANYNAVWSGLSKLATEQCVAAENKLKKMAKALTAKKGTQTMKRVYVPDRKVLHVYGTRQTFTIEKQVALKPEMRQYWTTRAALLARSHKMPLRWNITEGEPNSAELVQLLTAEAVEASVANVRAATVEPPDLNAPYGVDGEAMLRPLRQAIPESAVGGVDVGYDSTDLQFSYSPATEGTDFFGLRAAAFGAAGLPYLAEAVRRVNVAIDEDLCVSMDDIPTTLDGIPPTYGKIATEFNDIPAWQKENYNAVWKGLSELATDQCVAEKEHLREEIGNTPSDVKVKTFADRRNRHLRVDGANMNTGLIGRSS